MAHVTEQSHHREWLSSTGYPHHRSSHPFLCAGHMVCVPVGHGEFQVTPKGLGMKANGLSMSPWRPKGL